jgi:ankyrin repeat protein
MGDSRVLIDAIDRDGGEAEAIAMIGTTQGDTINSDNGGETMTPLAAAAQYENVEVLNALLGRPNIDVNRQIGGNGQTALMVAAESANRPILTRLLEDQRVNPNIVAVLGDGSRKTALDYAIATGRSTIIQALRQRNAMTAAQVAEDTTRAASTSGGKRKTRKGKTKNRRTRRAKKRDTRRVKRV